MSYLKKLGVFLPVLSAVIILGFCLGRRNSINWGNPDTAHIFLARYAKWRPLGAVRGKLTLRVGAQIFSYSTGDPQVTVNYLPPSEIANYKMPKVDMDKDFGQFVGLAIAPPAEAGVLGAIVRGADEIKAGQEALKSPEAIVVGVVTLGTFTLGYYLGHKTLPDYANPVFQQTLHDIDVWASYERDFRQKYAEARVFWAVQPSVHLPNNSGLLPPGMLKSLEHSDRSGSMAWNLLREIATARAGTVSKSAHNGFVIDREFYAAHPEVLQQAVQAPPGIPSLQTLTDRLQRVPAHQ